MWLNMVQSWVGRLDRLKGLIAWWSKLTDGKVMNQITWLWAFEAQCQGDNRHISGPAQLSNGWLSVIAWPKEGSSSPSV